MKTRITITLLTFFTIIFILPLFLPLAKPIDSYQGVAIYSNGSDFTFSHGRHYAWNGYYYGQKWQCVEFIKRYFAQAKKHQMPNVWGNACDFYNPTIPQGELNPDRGLIQYRNGGEIPPAPDDLLVFQNMTSYGHVAIITEVTPETVSIIQQNVRSGTRATLPLTKIDNTYFIGTEKFQATGWLRLP